MLRRTLAAVAPLAAATAVSAAEPSPVVPDFAPVAWLPAAGPALAKAGAPREALQLAPAARAGEIGDKVTLLVQESDGRELRQWAVVLGWSGVKPAEAQQRSPLMVMYLNNGHAVTFAPSAPAGMAIHVLGPFSREDGAAKAKDSWSGSLVNPQYLGLGLDRAVELMLRLRKAADADGRPPMQELGVGISSNPFPADVVARAAARLDAYHITPDEERAVTGLIPALSEFFQIASQTPGVRSIVFDVIELPWWSLVTHAGRIDDVQFRMMPPFARLPPAEWGLPEGTHVYSVGMQLILQGKPAANLRLAVTAPRAPLLDTAGIVGVAATRPDGKGPRVMVRVMAGRPAP